MKRIAIAVILAAAIPAAATAAKPFRMELQPAGDQTARMQNGVGAVDSHARYSTVRLIQPEYGVSKRGTIELLVMNHGREPFNLGPENVTARLADGTPVEIINYDRLMKEERKRQTWAAVAVGLGALGNSLSAANSGYTTSTVNYSGSTWGSYGRTPYTAHTYGTGTVTTYDPGRAQAAGAIAQRQNNASFAQLADQNARAEEALKVNLRTTTVDPEQMFGGSVMFELPKTVRKSKGDLPVTFLVRAGGEEHKFQALLTRGTVRPLAPTYGSAQGTAAAAAAPLNPPPEAEPIADTETLGITPPAGFQVAEHERDDDVENIKLIQPPETKDLWSKRISSLMYFDIGGAAPLDGYVGVWRDLVRQSCAGMTESQAKGSVDGKRALKVGFICPRHSGFGKPYNLQLIMVQGDANLMVAQVELMRQPTPADTGLMNDVFGSLRVCDKRTLATCSARQATGFVPSS